MLSHITHSKPNEGGREGHVPVDVMVGNSLVVETRINACKARRELLSIN